MKRSSTRMSEKAKTLFWPKIHKTNSILSKSIENWICRSWKLFYLHSADAGLLVVVCMYYNASREYHSRILHVCVMLLLLFDGKILHLCCWGIHQNFCSIYQHPNTHTHTHTIYYSQYIFTQSSWGQFLVFCSVSCKEQNPIYRCTFTT